MSVFFYSILLLTFLNPYECASRWVDVSSLARTGSYAAIDDKNLLSLLHFITSTLIRQPPTNVKNGRFVYSQVINNGEATVYLTKNSASILANHSSGNSRNAIAIVIQAKEAVIVRVCPKEDPWTVIEQKLHENDLMIFHAGEMHALLLPKETKILFLTDKPWSPGTIDRPPLITEEQFPKYF